jgi:hypothetical protein
LEFDGFLGWLASEGPNIGLAAARREALDGENENPVSEVWEIMISIADDYPYFPFCGHPNGLTKQYCEVCYGFFAFKS